MFEIILYETYLREFIDGLSVLYLIRRTARRKSFFCYSVNRWYFIVILFLHNLLTRYYLLTRVACSIIPEINFIVRIERFKNKIKVTR